MNEFNDDEFDQDFNASNVGNFDIVIRDNTALAESLKDKAPEWVREQFVAQLPDILPALFIGWKKGAEAGNSHILRQIAEASGLLASAGGGPVINNVINNQQVVNNNTTKMSVESIIRKMDEEHHRKSRRDDNIIDAEDLSAEG